MQQSVELHSSVWELLTIDSRECDISRVSISCERSTEAPVQESAISGSVKGARVEHQDLIALSSWRLGEIEFDMLMDYVNTVACAVLVVIDDDVLVWVTSSQLCDSSLGIVRFLVMLSFVDACKDFGELGGNIEDWHGDISMESFPVSGNLDTHWQ